MVEDRGDALLDRVDHQGLGAGAGGLQVQMAVDVPPLAVQYLVKVGGGVAIDGQAPGQGGIDMGMGIGKDQHDDAAPGIHELRLGILGLQVCGGAYCHDRSAVRDHAAVRQIAGTVQNYRVMTFPFASRIIKKTSSYGCTENKKGAPNHPLV